MGQAGGLSVEPLIIRISRRDFRKSWDSIAAKGGVLWNSLENGDHFAILSHAYRPL